MDCNQQRSTDKMPRQPSKFQFLFSKWFSKSKFKNRILIDKKRESVKILIEIFVYLCLFDESRNNGENNLANLRPNWITKDFGDSFGCSRWFIGKQRCQIAGRKSLLSVRRTEKLHKNEQQSANIRLRCRRQTIHWVKGGCQ